MPGPNFNPQLADAPNWLVKKLRSKKAKKELRSNGDSMIHEGRRNDALTILAGSMRHRGMGEQAILAALLEENAEKCEEPLDVEEVEKIAHSICRYEPAKIRYARSDAGNAEFFSDFYSDKVRYDHESGRWMIWRFHWWEADTSDMVLQLAKASARKRFTLSSDIDNLVERQLEAKWTIFSESRAKIESMLKLARSESSIAVPRGTEWNADTMLVGVLNGVIDLRTGLLRSGKRSDLISKHISLNYNPRAKCPQWLIFISEMLNYNAKLIRFVWKALGYSLTGSTAEQVFFILEGSGANGKSKFIKVVCEIFGDYASIAPFSLLTQQRNSQTNDIAALVGKRIVFSSETRKDTVFDEARVKMLSGSDSVTARFLYHENSTYTPQLKLWLALNHLPQVKDISHAFWRRVVRIHLDARFEGASDDKQIEHKLLTEGEGILAYFVKGARLYQKDGLNPPNVVLMATQRYQAQSDPLCEFIADCCTLGPGQTVGAGHFFNEYESWATKNGVVDTLSSVVFGNKMSARYMRKRSRPGLFYYGIGLVKIIPVQGV